MSLQIFWKVEMRKLEMNFDGLNDAVGIKCWEKTTMPQV